MEIRFTRSTRKHRVGRARALAVIANAAIVRVQFDRTSGLVRFLFLGDDETGRALEVIALFPAGQRDVLLVIHVMDLRPKYRPLYERGI